MTVHLFFLIETSQLLPSIVVLIGESDGIVPKTIAILVISYQHFLVVQSYLLMFFVFPVLLFPPVLLPFQSFVQSCFIEPVYSLPIGLSFHLVVHCVILIESLLF